MGKKVELFHKEIEIKVLAEVLAVYAIVALMLAGAYYLKPAITGFVTVTKQFNYTDKVDLEFSESGTYVWNLAHPGNLKNIKIDGSKSKEGEAKVYAEIDGVRYLIFDSSKLVEKESGIFGITGFAVLEDEGESESKEKDEEGKGKEPNHPPVWNSSIDSFAVNGSLTINLNDYFNDKDNDVLSYSASELKGGDLEILMENEILTVNNKNNAEGNRTLEITASDSETSKKKQVELILIKEVMGNETPINETPVNETIINETINKIIKINLEYGNNEVYDANNDGIESETGVIDFSVEGSSFNWDANREKLCTRYEVYSVENMESTFTCFGDNDCCNFVGLQSSRELWDESLFLSYGDYGTTADNIVFSQVLYVDYSLTADVPYSDVAYSSWGNLTAKFSDIIEFEDVCADTCLISGFNASSVNLVIELENAILSINKIKYLVEEKAVNSYPLLIKDIENVSILKNKEQALDLSNYFYDEDNDKLAYDYYKIDNITMRFEDNFAYVVPDKDFVGSRLAFITANDSYGQAVSNMFEIEVTERGIKILESKIKEKNWTVSFSTVGTGNLTISADYAELFDDNVSSANAMGISELKCGSFEIFSKDELIETEDLWFVLLNNSKAKLADLIGKSVPIKGMYVEDYNCDETGYYTVKVLAEGANVQQFNFGDDAKTVSSAIEGVMGETFEIRNEENTKLVVFDSFGNAGIKGNLTLNMEDVDMFKDENDFAIQNETNSLVLIKNPEGSMLLRGSLNENQTILAPTPNSFIVQNKNEEVVAYVNNSGSLFLKGFLTENVLFG